MDIEHLREYCLSLGDVTEKTPFSKFAAHYDSILVFYVLNHMFCIVDMDDFNSVNVISTPEEIEEILSRHMSAGPPRHGGLKNWICLYLNGDLHESDIYSYVKRGYDIVLKKYSGKTCRPRTQTKSK